MFHSLSRRRHVVVLTGILAIAPIGVAVARYGVPSFRATDAPDTTSRTFSTVNRRATLDLSGPQYSDRKGRFDIPLPASTGPETALPDDVIVSWNSLASLEYVGEMTGARVFGAGSSSAAIGSSPSRRRGGAASFATSSKGGSGVGAWGGVSGSGSRRQPAAAAPAARVVAAAAPKPAAPARPAAPPRASAGSSGGSSSGGGSSDTAAAAAAPAAAAPELVALAAPVTAPVFSQTPGASAPGTVVANEGPIGSPAATPEPITLMLMGTGLVGLYRARRYFE